MEKTKEFEIIRDKFIEDNSVSALATKPNQPATYGTGNLTAKALKEHFDSLAIKVIELYNKLANALNGVDAAEYITLTLAEGGSLRGLLDKIIDKDGNLKLGADTISTIIGGIKASIEDIRAVMLDLTKEEEQTMKGPLETPRIKTSIIEGVVKFLNSIVVNELCSNNLSIKDESGINTLLSVSKANNKGLLDVAALKTDAIAPSTNGGELTIRGNSARVTGDLDVDGNSTLGRTAKVVNAGGTPTVTIDGEAGEVKASRVLTEYTSASTATTGKLYTKQICSSGTGDRLIKIFHDLLGEETTTLDLYGSLIVSDNIDVGGNLNVKGKTINQIQESIIVEDNIIVTNSSGAGFSVSGIVMRTSLPDEDKPDASIEAYGILYSTETKAVMIGKGTLTEIPNVTTGAVTYEFTFTEGEALPLAARNGFGSESGGSVPMWNATQNAFVPSGAKVDADGNLSVPNFAASGIRGDVVKSRAFYAIQDANTLLPLATETYVNTYVDEQLDGIADILDKINNGGSTGGDAE